MQPYLSIITVTRNASSTVEDCVRSICGQEDFGGLAEHLLIDGASTDDTCARVARLSDGRSRIISEPDRGLYDAMNKGVRLAQGEVIGFLNADDLYAHERVLTRVAAAFRADPALGICHAGLCYVDRDDPRRIIRRWPAEAFSAADLRAGDLPPHPSVFMRRDLFLRLGGFDLSYRIAADSDLLFRAFLLERARHLSVDDCWVYMREGGVSNRSWKNVLQASRELRRSMRAAGMGSPWPLLARRYLKKLRQYLPGGRATR
jgi:glycosyltransferase